ncbi:hypothetical protein A3A79_04755 [Candidatus Gottesmanbacteria bacterium RIFCSPLOWO2_01_FULL_43_11b]|uniref:Glycosyltransferase RgtA/B/C/D-like domain-containing protein n=1 Tax=Candidatus Gottesmanbacteria bacterium RIFCSPLOWO2_01_FULL_43_11b TaxID=1798392 RepID=A0A1F6AID0_9BACT|nr:MAG: hypothetical protein A3A79_04755 [Candidatus Gottesmanbacteria bacterium RIFCSPLOWO2_01_FULL_43_11b]
MNKLIITLLLSWIVFSLGNIVFNPVNQYFNRYFNENVYQNLERLYNNSQYRQKNPISVIADEIVFRYAAAAYIRGADPILINSEHTPLGKYMIGLSFLWFQNDGVAIVFFAVLSLFTLWLLGKQIFKDTTWALVPVALWVTEPLFQNQLRVTPLLDIIQLPWILLALYAFIKKRFLLTAIFLGLVAATKSVVPSMLLVFSFFLFFAFKNKIREFFRFVPWLFISFCILALSYTRTFLNGYSLWDFLGFQKWILTYQQSKLIFPFSFWKLMFLNQWQTWWGDMAVHKAEDWFWTWPIIVLVPFILLIMKRKKFNDGMLVLVLWVFVYEIFLSSGIVVTRFLLPLIPILYILSVQFVREIIHRS